MHILSVSRDLREGRPSFASADLQVFYSIYLFECYQKIIIAKHTFVIENEFYNTPMTANPYITNVFFLTNISRSDINYSAFCYIYFLTAAVRDTRSLSNICRKSICFFFSFLQLRSFVYCTKNIQSHLFKYLISCAAYFFKNKRVQFELPGINYFTTVFNRIINYYIILLHIIIYVFIIL